MTKEFVLRRKAYLGAGCRICSNRSEQKCLGKFPGAPCENYHAADFANEQCVDCLHFLPHRGNPYIENGDISDGNCIKNHWKAYHSDVACEHFTQKPHKTAGGN